MADTYRPIRSGEPIKVSAWLDDDTPSFEGDDVFIHAELTDVDEVTLILSETAVDDALSAVAVHMPRTQAIALAGQLAWAATASHTELPKGHVNE